MGGWVCIGGYWPRPQHSWDLQGGACMGGWVCMGGYWPRQLGGLRGGKGTTKLTHTLTLYIHTHLHSHPHPHAVDPPPPPHSPAHLHCR